MLSNSSPQSADPIELQSFEAAQDNDAHEEEHANDGRRSLGHILKSLKKATGFGFYKTYVDSLCRDPLYASCSYDEILHGCFQSSGEPCPGVDIIEVIKESHGPVRVDLRGQNLSASEASMALRDPTPGAAAQVILWPIEDQYRGNEDLVDVLGLGLQLEPCFFEPLRRRNPDQYARYRSTNNFYVDSIGISVHVARKFLLTRNDPVPVILVAGPLHTSIKTFDCRPRSLPNTAVYGLVRGAPHYEHFQNLGMPHLANVYIRTLFNLVNDCHHFALTPIELPCACLVPLLQIEIAICKAGIDYLSEILHSLKHSTSHNFTAFRTKYIRSPPPYQYHREFEGVFTFLYRYRTELRSWIEYFDSRSGALLDLLSYQLGADQVEWSSCKRVKEETSLIARQATRLEAELRDYLQLQGTRSALEDSRKSIEASTRQIDEAKRVKVFTVLAFLYVPLNLATSIFGMNIQQLNGTGVSIDAFLGTAVAALFLTAIL